MSVTGSLEEDAADGTPGERGDELQRLLGGLAETGGSSRTPYVAGGALALLGIGATALVVTRRNRASS